MYPPTTTTHRGRMSPLPLLLHIQHKAQHIKRKLRVLETHFPKIPLRLVPQHMRSLSPETRHRFPDRGVVPIGVAVDVPRVDELCRGGAAYQVDFGVGESLQGGQAEFFGEGVDGGVVKELRAGCVHWGDGGVGG